MVHFSHFISDFIIILKNPLLNLHLCVSLPLYRERTEVENDVIPSLEFPLPRPVERSDSAQMGGAGSCMTPPPGLSPPRRLGETCQFQFRLESQLEISPRFALTLKTLPRIMTGDLRTLSLQH